MCQCNSKGLPSNCFLTQELGERGPTIKEKIFLKSKGNLDIWILSGGYYPGDNYREQYLDIGNVSGPLKYGFSNCQHLVSFKFLNGYARLKIAGMKNSIQI